MCVWASGWFDENTIGISMKIVGKLKWFFLWVYQRRSVSVFFTVTRKPFSSPYNLGDTCDFRLFLSLSLHFYFSALTYFWLACVLHRIFLGYWTKRNLNEIFVGNGILLYFSQLIYRAANKWH